MWNVYQSETTFNLGMIKCEFMKLIVDERDMSHDGETRKNTIVFDRHVNKYSCPNLFFQQHIYHITKYVECLSDQDNIQLGYDQVRFDEVDSRPKRYEPRRWN